MTYVRAEWKGDLCDTHAITTMSGSQLVRETTSGVCNIIRWFRACVINVRLSCHVLNTKK